MRRAEFRINKNPLQTKANRFYPTRLFYKAARDVLIISIAVRK